MICNWERIELYLSIYAAPLTRHISQIDELPT